VAHESTNVQHRVMSPSNFGLADIRSARMRAHNVIRIRGWQPFDARRRARVREKGQDVGPDSQRDPPLRSTRPVHGAEEMVAGI